MPPSSGKPPTVSKGFRVANRGIASRKLNPNRVFPLQSPPATGRFLTLGPARGAGPFRTQLFALRADRELLVMRIRISLLGVGLALALFTAVPAQDLPTTTDHGITITP